MVVAAEREITALVTDKTEIGNKIASEGGAHITTSRSLSRFKTLRESAGEKL
jgi:hypothetical protein